MMKIKCERFYSDRSEGRIAIEDKQKNISLTLTFWYYETRSSWGHKGYIQGHYGDTYCKKNDFKIVYLNRTWECYKFQSLIHKMIYGCGLKVDDKVLKKLCDKVDLEAKYQY